MIELDPIYYKRKIEYEEELAKEKEKNCKEINDFLEYLDLKCKELNKLIKKLPNSIDEINVNAPKDDNNVVFVPIECTYNKRFFARLYLAREHSVYGRIISGFDLVQFQIPVDRMNEPLILCLYGSHWINPPLISPNKECIGENYCDNCYNDVAQCSPILSIIANVESNSLFNTKRLDVKKTKIGKKYFNTIKKINEWIDSRTSEAIRASKDIVSDVWKSEYKLYQYIKIICPQVTYQYYAEWLGKQTLDIYMPEIRCAIEYQGKQHYEKIEYFGGERAWIEQKKRDEDKKRKCFENGVKYIEWPYKDKIVFTNVLSFLNTNNLTSINDEVAIKETLKYGLPIRVKELLVVDRHINTNRSEKTIIQEYEVRKYNLDGEYICSYQTMMEASKDIGVTAQQIQKAISGKSKSAGGFLWEKVKINSPVISIQAFKQTVADNTAKPIYQIAANGEIVNEFVSISAAERYTGINKKSIRYVLNGLQRTAGGFFWVYK